MTIGANSNRETKLKTPTEVAQALQAIYESDFGGKSRGRFQLSRQSLRELSERGRLEDSVIAAIANEAYEIGLVMIDLGDDFSIIELEVMRSYRKVPVRVIREHC